MLPPNAPPQPPAEGVRGGAHAHIPTFCCRSAGCEARGRRGRADGGVFLEVLAGPGAAPPSPTRAAAPPASWAATWKYSGLSTAARERERERRVRG